MEAKRNELKSLRETNERSYRQALANPSLGVSQRHTGAAHLTLPHGPALRTEERAARSRSASRHDARELGVGRTELDVISVPRERQAIERHIDRMDSAHAESRGTDVPHEIRHTTVSEAGTATAADIPADCDHQQWIQNGATTRERAERARAVARAKRQELEKKEQTRLCVFRREVGSGRTKDQVRPGPNCVFKPHQPYAETTDPPADVSDAPETNEEKPTACNPDLSAQHQHMEPSVEASDAPEVVSTVAQSDSVDEVVAETTEPPSNASGAPETNEEKSTAGSAELSAQHRHMEPSAEAAEASGTPEAVSTVAQGDSEVVTEDPSTYAGQTDQVRPGPNCVFRPHQPSAETTEPPANASDAPETNEEKSTAGNADLSAQRQHMEPSAEAFDATSPSVSLEVGIAVCHPEPEQDKKLAPDNEHLCKLGSHQSDSSEPTPEALITGKEQQADTSEPTPVLDKSCPPARVTATAGPHGIRSRLRQPTKLRDTPSVSTSSTTAQGRLRGVPAPSGGAFGSRLPRPCTNSR